MMTMGVEYEVWRDGWGRGGGGVGQVGGGFSHESEHDLALMVSEFLESSGSSFTALDSWCSSDSDAALSDLSLLADQIQFYRYSVGQQEQQLLSVVHSLILSMSERDLHSVKSGMCNSSCIRFHLAKLLRLSGYDSAVCSARWQGGGKVPGGDHEYIDVINYTDDGNEERLVIDLDFRSHFEIARAVDSYHRILNSLPAVYVGSLTRLKHFLRIMAEGARCSLKQNSMPLPPWRSFAYLQAKWQSPYQRHIDPIHQSVACSLSSDHKNCAGHLKRLQSSVVSEVEVERLWKPIHNNVGNTKPRGI